MPRRPPGRAVPGAASGRLGGGGPASRSWALGLPVASASAAPRAPFLVRGDQEASPRSLRRL